MKALRVFSIALLSGGTLFCAVWAVVALLRGSYLTTFVALAFVVCWLTPLLVWIIMPRVVARGTAGAAGTVIRPDKRVDALLVVCLIAAAVAMGCFATFGVMNKLDIPLPPDIGRQYAAIFFAPAGVCLLALVLVAMRRGNCYVRLTPRGFTFMEAFSAKQGEWSQVTAVTDEAPERPQAKSPLVMHMADGQSLILNESALYTPGGRALLALMRFYWQYPEHRAELTDSRALDRLRNKQSELGPGLS